MLVWASGKDHTNLTALHTNSNRKNGDIWAGPAGWPHVVSVFLPYPAQQTDASYGRDQQDPSVVGFYAAPTPNAPNATGGPVLRVRM